jgi:hypothetical protein
LEQQLHGSVQKCVRAIQAEFVDILDESAARLDAACEALGDTVLRLRTTEESLLPLLRGVQEDIDRLKRTAAHNNANEQASTPEECRSLCQRYCMLRFCERIWLAWAAYLRTIRENTGNSASTLISLRSHLQKLDERLGRSIRTRTQARDLSEHADEPSIESSALQSTAESLILPFDEKLRHEGKIKLGDMLSAPQSDAWKELPEAIRNEALAFLIEHQIGRAFEKSSSCSVKDDISALVGAIAPRLSRVGGGRRVLAVLPKQTTPDPWRKKLMGEFGNCVTTQQDAGGGVFMCSEVEGLEIGTIIDSLTHNDAGLVDMASRLHTRIDVDWS